MDEELGVGRLRLHALDVTRPDAGVDVALAHPDPQLSARDLLEPEAEVHVRKEEDLGVVRNRLDDTLGVPRRAAVVALRLHLGRRVHVGDDHRSRVLLLPGTELIRGDRRGERAAGVEVGDEHGLVGAQNGRRLGHEVDAAERDRVGIGRGRLAREPERVADEVRDILNLGNLVVVGEDHGAALGGERANLLVHGGDLATWSFQLQ